MSEKVEDFLAHYGVQGMKWGKRQAHAYAKDNFGRVSNEVGRRQNNARLNSTMSEASYRKLSDKDTAITKGSLLKRTTANPNLDSRVNQLFVSTNSADANTYRALIPTEKTGGFVYKKHEGYYETTLQATQSLKSPSEKKRVDGYIRLMGAENIKLANGEAISGREYLSRQGLGSVVDKMSNRQIALTYYGQLVANQGIRDDPINTAYFKDLSKQGYNSLIDDNDRSIISREPLLVLNTTNTLRTVDVKQLSTYDVHVAQATLRLP